MKKNYVIIAIIALLLPVMLSAQTLTNSKKRHINAKALYVISEYERLASLPSSDAQYEFRALFGDKATVVSDIMGNLTYLNPISIEEYIKELKASRVYTEISNVQRLSMNYDKEKWRMAISFKKQLAYYDELGVDFDVRRYYAGNDLDVIMNLVYDNVDDVCYIESIECKPNSSREFPRGRFIIVDRKKSIRYRDSRYFSMLKANDKSLYFDENGLAIYGQNTVFTVDDVDVEVKQSIDSERTTNAYDFVKFAFEPRIQRAKFKLAFAPIAYTVSCGDNIAAKSSAVDVGLDYGLMFSSLGNSKMGLYAGAGLSFSSISLSLKKEVAYSYSLLKKEDEMYVSQFILRWSIDLGIISDCYLLGMRV